MNTLLIYTNLLRFLCIKVSQLSVLLPVVYGICYYKQLNKAFRILFYFFCISFLFEVQATVTKMIYENNMPGLHLYTLVELFAFSAFYYLHFKKQVIVHILMILNTLGFTVAAVADAIRFDGIFSPNTLSRTYASLSLVCYSLIYFYNSFRDNYEHFSWEYPAFWVSIGVLIYFAVNLFYFMLNRYLINNASYTATMSLMIHSVINIIANYLFARSYRCFRKQTAQW